MESGIIMLAPALFSQLPLSPLPCFQVVTQVYCSCDSRGCDEIKTPVCTLLVTLLDVPRVRRAADTDRTHRHERDRFVFLTPRHSGPDGRRGPGRTVLSDCHRRPHRAPSVLIRTGQEQLTPARIKGPRGASRGRPT